MVERSVLTRSILCVASFNGCVHVFSAEIKSSASGSDATKNNDVHAVGFNLFVFKLSARIGSLLGREQLPFYCSAMAN